MAVDHVGGNLLNQLAMEEHDGTLNAHRVVSAATVYAVVNTAAAGEASVVIDGPVAIKGNLTLSDSKTFIGLVSVSGFANPLPVSQSGTWNVGTVTAVTDITNPISVKGNLTIDSGNISLKGNITISDSKGFIGLVTVGNTVSTTFSGNVTLDAGSKTGIVGNVTLSDSKGFIGLVTVGNTVSTTFSGNVTLDVGSKTGIVGNVTLSDSKTFIGLTTTTLGASPAFVGIVTVANASFAVTQSGTWDEVGINDSGNSITVDGNVGITGNVTLSDSKTFIGLVTIGGMSTVTLADPKGFIGLTTAVNGQAWPDPKTFIGLVTIGGLSQVTLSDSKKFIGLVTVGGFSTITLSDPKGFIGLVTVGGMSTVTLTDSKTFIGLVTAWSRNAGTTKTMINLPVTLSTSSVATIAVPTGGNALFYITQNLISSDATVRVSIKSGVTYLTGNASIGITLNPGGGWVENGGVDAPNYIGLASGAAIVVEKFDMTGTKANVGGKIMYFQE